MVTAARRHLATRFARGVDRLLWDLEKRPMPDTEAVQAVVSATAAGEEMDALDISAALVITQAMRLDLDLLEADVLDAAQASGISRESVAAVLELPDADMVETRYRRLRAKRKLPRALASPITGVPSQDPREAAARAGRRASQAADRAAEAGRRREQLSQARTDRMALAAQTHREHVELAAARASEARVNAKDAAERVALGLLRAADALERCAGRCEESQHSTAAGSGRDLLLRQQAEEYARATRSYREMAARYRDIGAQLP
jgi:hypothetical protein